MGFIDRWHQRILISKVWRKATFVSRKIVLPGFEGLNLYQVLGFFFEGLKQGRITTRAAAISFKVMLAIPPFLIILLSIIPFIPIENFQENLMHNISLVLPHDAFELMEHTLDDLINRKQQTLISLSFLLLLFYSSNAIAAILDGFSHSYHDTRDHGLVMQYVLSFGLMVVLSLLVIVGVGLIAFSGPVLSHLRRIELIDNSFTVFIIEVLKWIIVVLLFQTGISLLYRAGTKGKWSAFNAGATFATLGLIIVSSLFAWFVNSFGSYNKLYGSVGSILVVMLWFYFNNIVLLVGFEINTSIQQAKGKNIQLLVPEEVLDKSDPVNAV